LAASIKLLSNAVSGSVRTVVFTRALKGATKDHYSFNPSTVSSLAYISAKGGSMAFEYHTAHDSLTLAFSNPNGPTCVCDGGMDGKLCVAGNGTNVPFGPNEPCTHFKKGCVARSPTLGTSGEDSGDLLAMRNPTCNSAQYSGGLTCCKHKRIMLDDDQRQMDNGPLLRYHMKMRFWYQEYDPTNATNPNPLSPTKASHLPRILPYMAHITLDSTPY